MSKQSREAAIAIVNPKRIPGSPSFDEMFGAGRNPFNKSVTEVNQQIQKQIRNGGSK
jgi:hypothetical protein